MADQKYQKLATEYAKLRSQVMVLKKALIDEQEKSTKYEMGCREAGQGVRRLEQEVESLTFRNTQLATRVQVLQDEARSPAHQPKKLPKEEVVPEGNGGVLGEELQSKIAENMRLHQQLAELERERAATEASLRDRVTSLEQSVHQHEASLTTAVHGAETRAQQLQDKGVRMEVRVQQLEREVKEATERADSAEFELRVVQDKLKQKLAAATQLIHAKLPFNDSGDGSLSSHDIPRGDKNLQRRRREAISGVSGPGTDLLHALANWHSYTQQRTSLLLPSSQAANKLCEQLGRSGAVLRPLQQAWTRFTVAATASDNLIMLETAGGLAELSGLLTRYSRYTQTLLPYLLLSVEAEGALPTCPGALRSRLQEVGRALRRMVGAVVSLARDLALLVTAQGGGDEVRGQQGALFSRLAASLSSLHAAARELSRQREHVATQEHQLPTASQTLKTTNECLISSLVCLINATAKVSGVMSGAQGSLASGPGAAPHPHVRPLHRTAASHLATLAQVAGACGVSVPQAIAARDRQVLLRAEESQGLMAHQLSELRDRVRLLEREKEHWALEDQLVRAKLEQLMTRCGQEPGNREPPAAPAHPPGDSGTSRIPASGHSLGERTVTAADSAGGEGGESEREALIRQHYTGRLNTLQATLHTTDSRAAHFHTEVRALHRRLLAASRGTEHQKQELQGATSQLAHLKDELGTTSRVYEEQLSTMSEHMAGLNDQITSQSQEVEQLKQALVQAQAAPQKKSKFRR